MERVDSLMRQAVAQHVFPGGVLLVSKGNAILFWQAYGLSNLVSGVKMERDTIFDLASLTKPLATTLAIAWLVQQGKLSLEDTLGAVLPAFGPTEKSEIEVRHLLCHNSGLPAYRAFYETLGSLPAGKREGAMLDLLAREPLSHPIGETVAYSDLGFMILKRIAESASGQALDQIVKDHIYGPLGLQSLFFAGSDTKVAKQRFAATEDCRWRKELLVGVVHDENAYVMGGMEGHSGLFGTAGDVHALLESLLVSYRGERPARASIFEGPIVRTFFRRQSDSERALGFDMPSGSGSSSGRHFSEDTVGHLGFTGTSFWMDLQRSITIVLLTNRVHPSRDNIKLRAFRPRLHDSVMETIMDSAIDK